MTRNSMLPSRVSTLALAVALAAGPSPAVAQSLLGTPTVSSGSVNISEGSGTTDVTVDSPQAVIDWTPDDNLVGNFGAIAFQNSGTTATFSGASDFAVLNRINVADNSRQIFMNGTINGIVGEGVGGDIFFYSPSGFVIGSNAVINVGSLVLSASPIAVDGNGNFISGGTVTFNQAPNPLASITTVAGSSINAFGAGSYVAMVAPSIVHHGSIKTDRDAALVAAEAATITFSPDGLFNIEVTTGTDAAVGVDVDGGNIGRNSLVEGVGDHHAYLVAVAKNDAVTMLVRNGGSVGFDTATSATVEDNVVVLAGGYDVSAGQAAAPSGISTVGLTVDNADFSTDTFATITGGAGIRSVGGVTSFGGDLTLYAGNDSQIEAANGNALTIAGDLYANVDQYGQGASVTGKFLRLGAYQGSALTVDGNVTLSANSYGYGDGTNATGGTVVVQAAGNDGLGTTSSISIGGTLNVEANAWGGQSFDNLLGGTGTGGSAQVTANDGASVEVAGAAGLYADGQGGGSGECSSCGITGNTGTGGLAEVSTFNGTGNSISFGDSLTLSATGYGGAGDNGAGIGDGGTAQIAANDGSVTVNGDFSALAFGYGGYGFSSIAGDGLGGIAAIYGNNATLTLLGDAELDASGIGGSTDFDIGGFGGDGTGGRAEIYLPNGQLNISGTLLVTAVGEGGDTFDGIGGDGLGGTTAVGAGGGAISVSGNLFMDGSAAGGDGATGGNATALTTEAPNEAGPIATALYAQNNGTIDVEGVAVLTGDAVGGNGTNGNGGNAQGGEGDVVAYFGDITLGSLLMDVNAYGGSGGNGGIGGNAVGGNIDVTFGLGAAAVGGTIDLGSATITADGYGGAGGDGAGGNFGGNGGAGGSGTGGFIIFAGSAAGGNLISGSAVITALGEGGDGGAGGNGDSGTGGNGGDGGLGQGGFVQTGTISADAAPGSGGGATYTTLDLDMSASGGNGGNAGTGGGGGGTGGNGGNALGGRANFLARGVLVTADTVTLAAGADGGDGGSGLMQGDGGDATTGYISVESKDRFGHPTERGTLEADSIIGTAIATGGIGGTDGVSIVADGSYFRVLNGDATIGTLSITLAGSQNNTTEGPSLVSVRDGVASIGDFSFITDGELALDASNGSMTAGTITLSAATFVPDNFNPPPSSVGAYSASTFDITTGGDFITNAELVSGSGLAIAAPGVIDMVDATADGAINFSGTSITAGNLSGGGVTLNSAGDILAGDITSTTNVSIGSNASVTVGDVNASGLIFGRALNNFAAGDILTDAGIDIRATNLVSLGNLDAGGLIDLRSNNGITVGDAITAETIYLMTAGQMSAGTLTAGDSVLVQGQAGVAVGAVSAGLVNTSASPTATYRVRIASDGLVDTGTIDALGRIGLYSLTDISVGNLTTGEGVTALAGGDVSTGAIQTPANGYTYFADASMAALGGTFDNFDPAPILAATPVRTGGSILISGPVSTGSFQAAAGTTLTAQAITAPLGIYLDAGGNIVTGALGADDDIEATSDGSIQTGDISSTLGNAVLSANGSVATGAIDVGGSVQLTSATAHIATGNITGPNGISLDSVTGVSTGNILSSADVIILNGGSILTGDINSTGGFIYLQSDVDIVTGAIDTPFDAEFDALGNISLTGNVNAGGYLFADAGGNLAMASATTGESIDVIAGGTIIGGNMTAGDSVVARAAGAVTLGNLSAGIVNPSSEPVDGQIVAIGSLTSVSTGDISARGFVGLASDGALTAGTVESLGDVMVLVDGPANIGAIFTGAQGRTYVAGFDMLAIGGGFGEGFDPSLVYAANPIQTGGSFTVSGSTVTPRLDAFVGGNLTLGPVSADTINARSGGLATINGLWEASDVELWSTDIDIAANAGIDAGTDGNIHLQSTNASGALIGDGLSGSGYALSNAEFGRISAGNLLIATGGAPGADGIMKIGDLTITGPSAGSTIESSTGGVTFATVDEAGTSLDGTLSVVGDVLATGFGADNFLEFASQTVEVNADTGSIGVESSPGTLSGIIDITAERIHVASGDVLTKLADDPQYSGREADLAAPIASPRPDGVISAATIYVSPTEAVLVQNTGTSDLPAGFRAGYVELFPPEGAAAGSIEMIVNGQLVTEGGTLTGVDVRDALVIDTDLSVYSANSTINGCALVGACAGAQGPFPPEFIPTPGIQDEVVLIGANPLPPPPFGNEDVIDDNDEETEDDSPIIPPDPLFDTTELGEAEGTGNPAFNTPMRSNPGLTEEGDVDDPVSGSGNPALMETPDPAPTGQQEKQP